MNHKSPEVVLKRPVCTWLAEADYERFETIARSHGVTVAAFLRSIVVDAIADDIGKVSAVPEIRHAVAV